MSRSTPSASANHIICLTIAVFLLSVCLIHLSKASETQRFGLFVGQNDGGPAVHRLLYAEQDAKNVAEVLERLGGIPTRNARVLLGPSRRELEKALASLKGRIQSSKAQGSRTVFYFYYSGHANKDGLLLGKSQLGLFTLKAAIKDLGADLRILLLDACQSGAATRTRGGTLAPSFLVQVEEGEHLEGEVVITSSAQNEASQESDRVGGGYFTHHLIAGLMGAADVSRDGQVSLEEAYSYTYHRTLFETAGSAGGLQHPSFRAELQGHGALVLTRPAQGQTVLVFPAGLEGRYLIFDRSRKLFVAELTLDGGEERHLALPAGKYLIQKRELDHLLTAELILTRGAMKAVDEESMVRSGFEADFSRGVAVANVRRATRSPMVLNALVGVQRFFKDPPGAVLFPDTPLIGMELEWRRWFGDLWTLGMDLSLGSSDEVLSIDGNPYDIPAHYGQMVAGVSLKYDQEVGRLRYAAGPHLAAFYIRRSFPGSSEPFQDYVSVTPGLTAELDIKLSRRVSLGLVGRGHYLYYLTEGDDQSLGYTEAFLRTSFHF